MKVIITVEPEEKFYGFWEDMTDKELIEMFHEDIVLFLDGSKWDIIRDE